jgi:hypothetical protein
VSPSATLSLAPIIWFEGETYSVVLLLHSIFECFCVVGCVVGHCVLLGVCVEVVVESS